ncbi:MAG: twin-arginine translocase TatA/TatE family subunit [Muribaculaceae bacterium]|nr:twin-arginine translocase TatA/TatE family subunit [Muribaculaceae bacterium]
MNSILIILPLFLGNMRGAQFIIVLLVVLLLFGGKKIPELMRGLGKGISSFKQGLREAQDEINKPADKTTESSDSSLSDEKAKK